MPCRNSETYNYLSCIGLVAGEYQEFENDIVSQSGKCIKVRWFNTYINDNHRWSFSFGVTHEEIPIMTEHSIRSYYKDILMKDRTMLKAIKDTLEYPTDNDKTCETTIE